MEERSASNIPVDPYVPGKDFNAWVKRFEEAVQVATKVTEPGRLAALYKLWLPLKLDDHTCTLFRKCTDAEWDRMKTELKNLMVDPQDRYEWRSGRLKVTWDGKESFHVYESRVKCAVDTYEDPPRPTDYFHVFKKGLPEKYAEAIDLGANAETIEEAKRVAIRYHTAQSNKGSEGKSVSFTGASMSDDRLKAIELSLQGMSVKVDNFDSNLRKVTDRVDSIDVRNRRSSGDRHPDRSLSRGYADRNDDRDYRRRDSPEPRHSGGRPYGRDDGRGRRDFRGRSDSRDRYRAYNDRSYDYSRSRRDFYDRDYDDRYDSRYDRRDEWQYRDSGRSASRGRSPGYDDRGDRFDSRNRRDNSRPRRFSNDRGSRDRRSPGRFAGSRRDSRDRYRGRSDDQPRRDDRDRPNDLDRGRREDRSSRGNGNFSAAELEEHIEMLYAMAGSTDSKN